MESRTCPNIKSRTFCLFLRQHNCFGTTNSCYKRYVLAEDRLGADRIRGAYAYQDILKYGKRLALGTDFPVEKVTPMFTFYSAVARQDHEGNPAAGFLPEQRLTREQTLRGMTIWAAYSNFEEKIA